MADDELADYDFVEARTRTIEYEQFNTPARYFSALLTSPPVAAQCVRMGQLARRGQLRGSYTDAERELVDVVLGTDLGYNSIFTVHLPDAIAVGVRPEAILAIRSGDESELTDDERQIAAWARQVVSGSVTDESFAAMVERLGERGTVEFTAFVAFLFMTIRMWQALGVPEPSDQEIDQLVVGLLDGSMEIPDPTSRIG
ncbi:carboxymuconolactone decarboxylase family protein [[Mycobacterium] nativiensis]|uniref:Carboxymuconolactone decarboxylase n=1 Tax=[Mycobacterium] nativiensis TaxID=2855503 RepID=A0ABU5XV35_9MYCO|nr:hypothetical protein [Mycolicibacter sp. MYC340]MEB3031795.1 hypothetical protein [Mycolicibacter sp. MYC340]